MICTETEIEKVLPGEVGDTDPSSPVDESENGQDGQTQPPEPQDEEVLLVEQVVGQDAQVVGPVDTTRGSSNTDVAGNLHSRISFAGFLQSHSRIFLLRYCKTQFLAPEILQCFQSHYRAIKTAINIGLLRNQTKLICMYYMYQEV